MAVAWRRDTGLCEDLDAQFPCCLDPEGMLESSINLRDFCALRRGQVRRLIRRTPAQDLD
jgi:hypothetical protein